MKIAISMIVFNGKLIPPDWMLRANIEAMYPWVSQIIICEGATAKQGHGCDGDATAFTKYGGSLDGTLAAIRDIPDMERKIKLIPARGFWSGKTAMCNEILKHVDHDIDYVWQVDVDEFYRTEDMPKIMELLRTEPSMVEFWAYHFWGGFTDHVSFDSGFKWGNDLPWRRIFKYEPGAAWKSHEPPNLLDSKGRSCDTGKVILRPETYGQLIRMYHYGYVQRQQAEFKQAYYKNPSYLPMWDAWQKNKSTPLINGCVTEPFTGQHPKAIIENL